MDIPMSLSEYFRVLKTARSPKMDEFWKVSLISIAGILLVGGMGFLIFILMSFLPA